jgi:hypothetical protein
MTATLRTTIVQEPSSASANITLNTSGGVSLGATSLSAGTTSVAALAMTSGSRLTTATAGSFEFDGRTFTVTPQSTERGLVLTPQYVRLDSGYVGSNVNTAQTIFGLGTTVSSSTIYVVEGFFVTTKTAGTTSHTMSITWGGTATLNNLLFDYTTSAGSGGLPVGSSNFVRTTVSTVSSGAITGSMTSASQFVVVNFKGSISVNVGGTFLPQYVLSAAPGGAYTTNVGSYILIYPVGASGSTAAVGNWS